MTTVSVATINLLNNSERWSQRRHLLVAQLVDAAPDLISLQEIHMPIAQGRWLRHQINIRLSGKSKQPYRLITQRKKHPIHGYFEGIGILTKLPVIDDGAISLGYGGRVALRAHVLLPSRQALSFVSVHLHHVAEDKEARQEQVMQLAGWLDTYTVPRQVIAGDFNELPDGPAIRFMRQRYRSAFAERWGHDPLATFPTALISNDGWAGCLDYIFVSAAVRSVRSARIFCQRPHPEDQSLYPSDHVGLLATIEV